MPQVSPGTELLLQAKAFAPVDILPLLPTSLPPLPPSAPSPSSASPFPVESETCGRLRPLQPLSKLGTFSNGNSACAATFSWNLAPSS
eukprot:882007-Pleurochrysis_carterae.AAC.1